MTCTGLSVITERKILYWNTYTSRATERKSPEHFAWMILDDFCTHGNGVVQIEGYEIDRVGIEDAFLGFFSKKNPKTGAVERFGMNPATLYNCGRLIGALGAYFVEVGIFPVHVSATQVRHVSGIMKGNKDGVVEWVRRNFDGFPEEENKQTREAIADATCVAVAARTLAGD